MLRLLPVFLLAGCLDQMVETPEVFDEQAGASTCEGKCDGGDDLAALGALPESTLATLFAPYEPALGLDLLLAREVMRARAADPAVYAEGENPYRIRFAVYNLDNPHIARALADAEDMNIDVQVLIEDDQLDPARDYNVQDDYLVSRGFELVRGHKTLTAATRKTADLIGVTGSGLMHLKTRIYSWRADGVTHSRVVSGSMNPGQLAVHNDETLHYIAIPDVVARYEAKFDAVLRGVKLVNTWSDGAAAQVLFTPDGGVQAIDRIARLIDDEREMILLAVFSLRNMAPTSGGKGILERLVDAHHRGVAVYVITDRKQSDGVDADGNPIYWNDPSEEILKSAGVPVFEVLNRVTPYNAMHCKYGVFGLTNPIVVTDAGNWSRASLGSGSTKPSNDESVLFLDTHVLDGGVTGLRYLGNFLSILDRYGLDTRGVLAHLQALPGWPRSGVVFTARAETVWGQQVRATGDLAELTQWGRGVALDTTAQTYPRWISQPVSLPFGSRVEYKLIKDNVGRITWEAGGNRTLTIDPTDRRVVGGYPVTTITTDLTWR